MQLLQILTYRVRIQTSSSNFILDPTIIGTMIYYMNSCLSDTRVNDILFSYDGNMNIIDGWVAVHVLIYHCLLLMNLVV